MLDEAAVNSIMNVTKFLSTTEGQILLRVFLVWWVSHYAAAGVIYDLLDEVMDTKTQERKRKVKRYAGFLANVLCGLIITWMQGDFDTFKDFLNGSLPYIGGALLLHFFWDQRQEKKRKEAQRNAASGNT